MHGRPNIREKLAYGTGSLTYGVEMMVVLNYLMLYCSDVLQINVAFIATFMMAVKALDAVTDLVVMSIADRTNTRWGKYKPWILNGIPLAAVLVAMFSSPGFLQTEQAKVAWVCIAYCLLVPVLETSLNAPFLALGVTLTDNRKDRLDLANMRALGEAASAIVVSAIAMPLILHFGGYRDPAGWRYMTYAIALIVVVSSLVCFFGTKERIRIDNTVDGRKQMSVRQKATILKGVAPFWKLTGIIVLYMSQFYAGSSIFTYFCIHALGHEEWIAPLTSIGFGAQIIITFALFYLGRRFEKRTLLIWACGLTLGANLILFNAHGFTSAAIYQVIWGIGNGIFNSIAFSMIPDLSDYVQHKTKVALPGAITAVINFVLKIGSAFAVFLTGRILVFAQYNAALAVQDAFTQTVIRFSLPVYSSICIALTLAIVFVLKELSADKVDKYRVEINQEEKDRRADTSTS